MIFTTEWTGLTDAFDNYTCSVEVDTNVTNSDTSLEDTLMLNTSNTQNYTLMDGEMHTVLITRENGHNGSISIDDGLYEGLSWNNLYMSSSSLVTPVCSGSIGA